MITLRLDPRLEQMINQVSHELNMTPPWELGADLFGQYANERHDLSKNRKKLVKEKIKTKKWKNFN